MPELTSVVDAISFPPLGVLNPVLDTAGPYGAGSHTLDTFTTGGAFALPAGTYQVHGTYGVIAVPSGAVPIQWGLIDGYDSGGALGLEGVFYFQRLCQLVPMHQVLSGFFLPIERHDVHFVPDHLFWPFRLIGGDVLGLWVPPAISIDLYYLCIL